MGGMISPLGIAEIGRAAKRRKIALAGARAAGVSEWKREVVARAQRRSYLRLNEPVELSTSCLLLWKHFYGRSGRKVCVRLGADGSGLLNPPESSCRRSN